jgi:hypothetical protein
MARDLHRLAPRLMLELAELALEFPGGEERVAASAGKC